MTNIIIRDVDEFEAEDIITELVIDYGYFAEAIEDGDIV